MQTFLPFPDFRKSLLCLDQKRLGKQRVETLQILNAILDPTKGWKNHPATIMWRKFPKALQAYGIESCLAWRSLGFKDSCLEKISSLKINQEYIEPPWLGDERLHRSHRSNLTRKDPIFYSKFWEESADMPYFWPSKDKNYEL